MTSFPQTTTKKITQAAIISVKHQLQRRHHRKKKKKKHHRRCARRKQAKSYAIRRFPKREASLHRQQLKKKNHQQRNQLLKNVNDSPRAARLNDFKCKARRRLTLNKNQPLRHLRHRPRISSQHQQKSQKNINNNRFKNHFHPHNQ